MLDLIHFFCASVCVHVSVCIYMSVCFMCREGAHALLYVCFMCGEGTHVHMEARKEH